MLVCVPVSLADRKLIPCFEKAFSLFPPGSGHRLLVVGSPNVENEVTALAQSLSPHFAGEASHLIFDSDNASGWPLACNHYFQIVAYHMHQILSPEESWFWLELDAVPLKAAWLDEITATVEHSQSSALKEKRERPIYFGTKEQTYIQDNGQLMAYSEAGHHMGACGVYPAVMPTHAQTLRTIVAVSTPWNIFMRWYILGPYFQELPVIQNNWRTASYERTPEGKISCKSIANWAWEEINFNADVRPEAILLHGCKDGSLIELLAAEHEEVKEEGIPPQEYWTDADLEVPAQEEPKPKPVPKSYRRRLSKEQIEAARKRLLAMHERRRASKQIAGAL